MIRLIELRAENFKRLVAINIHPNTEGVTALVGKNGAGKTSVLDAIECALGGTGRAPELPIRTGQTRAEVVLDLDDLIVRRRWTDKGSDLEVSTKDGAAYKGPQGVLDKLVGALAFDPLAFGRAKPADQSATLARLAGVDLDAYKAKRQGIFDQRTTVNRLLKEVRAALGLMKPVPEGTPAEEVSVTAIFEELGAVEAQQKEYDRAQQSARRAGETVEAQRKKIDAIVSQLEYERSVHKNLSEAHAKAEQHLAALPVPPDPEPIRERGRGAEQINRNVTAARLRANREREVAAKEAEAEQLTQDLNAAGREFADQLAAAPIPVPGLGITSDGVTLNGIPFGQCSGAEKLRLSVAIGLALNPKLKLMLIRDGSLLDDDGMRLLAEMAEAAGAQVLIERVDTGREVGVRIVDGEVEGASAEPQAA